MTPFSRRCTAATIAAVCFAVSSSVVADDGHIDAIRSVDDPLPRAAELGFRAVTADGTLVVRSVERTDVADAGLRDGDVIEAVNGEAFEHPYQGQALLVAHDGGTSLRLAVRREDETFDIAFTPPPRDLEAMPGVMSHYGSVQTEGGVRLRTIITIPEGAEAPLAPLLFTQWVSCGSIEYREGGSRSILGMLARRSGLALVRVERAGAGDSEGAACHELDYDTELAHYVSAFSQVLESDLIDPARVYLFGSSLGSTTAPLVAKALQDDGVDIAGVAVQGGGAQTYFERMLMFDRIYLERRPDDVAPTDIHSEVISRARFQYEYLINRRDPDDIAADSPEMAAVRADTRGLGRGEHYGRPYAWHQQAAAQNFLGAWAAIEAPVLVIYNAFEQFEPEYGHALITDTVNRLRPGTATFVRQENIGHSNTRYPNILDAYAGERGEPAWEQTADVLVEWFRDEEQRRRKE